MPSANRRSTCPPFNAARSDWGSVKVFTTALGKNAARKAACAVPAWTPTVSGPSVSGRTAGGARPVRAAKRAGDLMVGVVKSRVARVRAEIASEAATASAVPPSRAAASPSQDRAWIVQATWSSSQAARTRSTL